MIRFVRHRLNQITPFQTYLVILVIAIIIRLYLATQAPNPGIFDPTYYFNLARNLVHGRGLVIDFIWQYHNPPADITHVPDYYPPLTAIIAAVSMRLFGESVFAALLPSVLFGGLLLPALTWQLGKQFGLHDWTRVFATGAVAFTPEFVLNAVRTDTTIFFVVFGVFALLAFYRGLTIGQISTLWLLASGVGGGLAYLTRSDAILLLPTFAVSALLIWRLRPHEIRPQAMLKGIFVPILAFVLTAMPLWLSNQTIFGRMVPIHLNKITFLTQFIDIFSYQKEHSLDSYLRWGVANIIGKIGFEAFGNAKMMIVLLSVMSPLVGVGLILLATHRLRAGGDNGLLPDGWRLLVPAGVFLLGISVWYTAFMPFLNQGGAFKKAVMSMIPFAMLIGAHGLDALSERKSVTRALQISTLLLLIFYCLDLVRNDFKIAAAYDADYRLIVEAARQQGDVNGDGRITVYAAEPFQAAYHGLYAVVYPSDERAVVFEVANRYRIDYFVFPAERPLLDTIARGEDSDSRLTLLWQKNRQGPYLYKYGP